MAITEIIAFILKMFGWIADFTKGKKDQAQAVLGDMEHEMKKKAGAVKLHGASVEQSIQSRLRRKEILEQLNKKDETTF
jgi:hypothetical protein